MIRIAVLILRLLITVFGQRPIWEAFKTVTDRRLKMKMLRFDEREKIRELKNEMKLEKLERKREKRNKKQE